MNRPILAGVAARPSVCGLLACLLTLSACDNASPESGEGTPVTAEAGAHFTTDAPSYTLRSEGPGWTTTIGFAFRNDGADTVSVVNCNGAIVMSLQRRGADGWQDAWHGVTNSCLSPPLQIPPGTTIRSTIGVWGAEAGNTSYPAFLTPEIDGEYRLVWHQLRRNYEMNAPNFGDTLTVDERVSAPFELQRDSVALTPTEEVAG